MLEAVFVLYLARALGVGPALLGIIFAIGSAGFVIGALLPDRLAPRIGVGPATAAGIALVGLSDLLVPLAAGSLLVIVPLLVAAQFCFGLGLTVFNVNQVSFRQAIAPDQAQGRATASVRVLASVLVPLGALLGGLLGELFGLAHDAFPRGLRRAPRRPLALALTALETARAARGLIPSARQR